MPKPIETLAGADAAAFQTAIAPHVEAVAKATMGYALSGSVNLFDPAAVSGGVSAQDGRECYYDGSINAYPNSWVSALMPVSGAKVVGIFGLGLNEDSNRYVQWFGPGGEDDFIGFSLIPGRDGDTPGINAALFTPPDGATFMRFSPRQRCPGSSDFSAVRVYASSAPWAGLKHALLGDSITEITDVDASKYQFGQTHNPGTGNVTSYRENWPTYAIPRLLPSRLRSYAKSGGRFSNVADGEPTRNFSQQVTNLIADGTAPDVITIAIGTNDWGNSTTSGGGSVVLGTAAAALAKDYGDLDLAISMDGMRQGLHRLRYYFPNAVIFGMLPIQRGDFNPENGMRAWVEDMRVMFRAYGVEVIDQFNELGIRYPFETVNGSGQHLGDRIHPLMSGQKLQADLVVARLRARLG